MGKKLLFEVSIIRPLIIILLLFYHSFACWGGIGLIFNVLQNVIFINGW